jgi:hypothetical protein
MCVKVNGGCVCVCVCCGDGEWDVREGELFFVVFGLNI